MPRDDFSAEIKLRLAKRAGFRCSFTGCRRYTVGPSNEAPSAVACVGIAAHIAAAATGGRRFDPSMTLEGRSSIENGLWLCATHAALIDRDAARYTVAVLRQMKVGHEAFIQQCVDGGLEEPPDDPLAQRISSTAQSILRAMDDLWEYRLFAQVLRDELVKYADIARDLRYGVTLHRRRVNQSEFLSIARGAMSQVPDYCNTLVQLFEEPLRDAIGLPGFAGDPQAICYIGARMAEVYRAVLEWGLSWHELECDWPESHGFIALMPECVGSIVAAIERLPDDIEAQVRAALDYQGDTPMIFQVSFTMDIPEHIQRRMKHEVRRMTGVTGATRKPRVRKRWVFLALIAIVYLMRFCGK